MLIVSEMMLRLKGLKTAKMPQITLKNAWQSWIDARRQYIFLVFLCTHDNQRQINPEPPNLALPRVAAFWGSKGQCHRVIRYRNQYLAVELSVVEFLRFTSAGSTIGGLSDECICSVCCDLHDMTAAGLMGPRRQERDTEGVEGRKWGVLFPADWPWGVENPPPQQEPVTGPTENEFDSYRGCQKADGSKDRCFSSAIQQRKL